jgi:hypothetical protein
MTVFSWECPYCNQHATITDANQSEDKHIFFLNNKYSTRVALTTLAITCPNTDCKEIGIYAWLNSSENKRHNDFKNIDLDNNLIKFWQLLPESNSKIYPDFIPQAILNDYEESCKIINLSPKASATLARRCLQGIIRDFWKVKPNNLNNEINQIEEKVDPLIFDAINAVRQLGNIGAHMEKDINLIVDVDPDEAKKLIELIEILLEEWYIARNRRQEKLQSIKAINEAKQQERKAAN